MVRPQARHWRMRCSARLANDELAVYGLPQSASSTSAACGTCPPRDARSAVNTLCATWLLLPLLEGGIKTAGEASAANTCSRAFDASAATGKGATTGSAADDGARRIPAPSVWVIRSCAATL